VKNGFLGLRRAPRPIVSGTTILRLEVIPGTRNPRGKYRPLFLPITVGMQPFEEQGHVASEFAMRGLGRRAQNAVTIGAWMQENLLNKKSGGFPYDLTRSVRALGGMSDRLFIPGSDTQQEEHIFRKRGRPDRPHLRGEVHEINSKLYDRCLPHNSSQAV
jgi:hypothetical protein